MQLAKSAEPRSPFLCARWETREGISGEEVNTSQLSLTPWRCCSSCGLRDGTGTARLVPLDRAASGGGPHAARRAARQWPRERGQRVGTASWAARCPWPGHMLLVVRRNGTGPGATSTERWAGASSRPAPRGQASEGGKRWWAACCSSCGEAVAARARTARRHCLVLPRRSTSTGAGQARLLVLRRVARLVRAASGGGPHAARRAVAARARTARRHCCSLPRRSPGATSTERVRRWAGASSRGGGPHRDASSCVHERWWAAVRLDERTGAPGRPRNVLGWRALRVCSASWPVCTVELLLDYTRIHNSQQKGPLLVSRLQQRDHLRVPCLSGQLQRGAVRVVFCLHVRLPVQ